MVSPPQQHPQHPQHPQQQHPQQQPHRHEVRVYTDGGTAKTNPSPHGGAACAVFTYQDKEILRQAWPVLPSPEAELITSNNCELLAVAHAVITYSDLCCPGSLLEPYRSECGAFPYLRVMTDSQLAMCWFKNEYKFKTVPDFVVEKVRQAWQQACLLTGRPEFTLMAGHPTAAEIEAGFKTKPSGVTYPVSRWNKETDALCRSVCKNIYENRQRKV